MIEFIENTPFSSSQENFFVIYSSIKNIIPISKKTFPSKFSEIQRVIDNGYQNFTPKMSIGKAYVSYYSVGDKTDNKDKKDNKGKKDVENKEDKKVVSTVGIIILAIKDKVWTSSKEIAKNIEWCLTNLESQIAPSLEKHQDVDFTEETPISAKLIGYSFLVDPEYSKSIFNKV